MEAAGNVGAVTEVTYLCGACGQPNGIKVTFTPFLLNDILSRSVSTQGKDCLISGKTLHPALNKQQTNSDEILS